MTRRGHPLSRPSDEQLFGKDRDSTPESRKPAPNCYFSHEVEALKPTGRFAGEAEALSKVVGAGAAYPEANAPWNDPNVAMADRGERVVSHETQLPPDDPLPATVEAMSIKQLEFTIAQAELQQKTLVDGPRIDELEEVKRLAQAELERRR